MNIDYNLDRILSQNIRDKNDAERAKHKKSGKLSAGQLGMPIQWQILNALKVEGKEHDDFTLRKFMRGNDVEDSIVEAMGDLVLDKQVDCNYRDVVGKLDVLADAKQFTGITFPELKNEEYLPIEIKSVTNADFKWINKKGECKEQHMLQAGLYALSSSLPYYSVMYVASDDYRVTHFIGRTKDIKPQIDKVIDRFQAFWERKEIPEFAPLQKWMELPKYNNYPDYSDLTLDQLNKLADKLYKEVK